MRRWLAAAALAFAVVLPACGDDGGADMSSSAARSLETSVTQIRQAVEANDDDAARAHLTSLRTTVASLAVSEFITADRASEINEAIAGVEKELVARAVPATPTSTSTTRAATTSTSTTTSTTTTEAPRGNGKDKDDDD